MQVFVISAQGYQRDALCCLLSSLFPAYRFRGLTEQSALDEFEGQFNISEGLVISTQALPLLDRCLKASLFDHLIISPHATTETLTSALRQLLPDADQTLISAAQTFAADQCDKKSAEYRLTPKQLKVLALLIEGDPSKHIAKKLNLSPSTIKTHIAAIFRAFRVRTRMELLLVTEREGLRLIASQHSLMQTRTYQ
jgi:DNA-binding CsgD family transcriptional regulator